jgi:hypothetical protein
VGISVLAGGLFIRLLPLRTWIKDAAALFYVPLTFVGLSETVDQPRGALLVTSRYALHTTMGASTMPATLGPTPQVRLRNPSLFIRPNLSEVYARRSVRMDRFLGALGCALHPAT